jgi:hypothetical protein
MYHIFAKTPIVKEQAAQQFGEGGVAKIYEKGDLVTYKGKPARVQEWMRLKLRGIVAVQYRLQMSNGRFTGWVSGDKIKPKKMANGGEAGKDKAKAMLSKVFRTPDKCSDAGATLATDSLPKVKKAPAGKRLGSLKCKTPARTRRTALSGSGKGYIKSKKK